MNKNNAVVGLDIEAGSVAATEVSVNGSPRVGSVGIAPLAPGLFGDGEVLDPEGLGAAIGALFSQQKLPKSVRIGIANQRLAMRVLELPPIDDRAELERAVRFQAADELPMPLDQAVLDFQVIGGSTDASGNGRISVAVVAARRDMVSAFVEVARRAGLRPVGIDLSSFAVIRALAQDRPGDVAADGTAAPRTTLCCNIGDLVNLAVARGSSCTFTRVAPFGLESIAGSLSERSGLTLDHARQWLTHVGLQRPVNEIEGDAEAVAATRQALEAGASKLVDELRLSLDFYSNQESAPPVEEIVFCGPGTAIGGLAEVVSEGVGLPITTALPAALGHLDQASAARLTVAYGLALEA